VRSHPKAAFAAPTHRENNRFSLGVIAAMLVCAAAFLGIGAPAASAAAEAGPGWAYQSTFGTGFENLVYEQPRSPIAVDSNGNVFAIEENRGEVRVYSPGAEPEDEPLTTFGAFGNLARNLAIDLSNDSVYIDQTTTLGGTTITRYTSDGQPTPTYTRDLSFEVPQAEGIAVDPTSGDLLVADPAAEGVRRYDDTGVLLETIPTPSIAPAWVVASPDGSFYVAPAEGPDVTHFSGSGTLLGTATGVGALHGLTWDAARSVLVAAVGDKLKSYSPAGSLRAESPAQDSEGIGIAVNGDGSLLYEHHRTNLNTYAAATVPGVVGPDVSGIGAHTVHLSAEVDPGAGPPAGSAIHFELSVDGGKTWTSTATQAVAVAGTYEADVATLLPNQEYLARAVASNDLIAHTTEAVSFSTSVIAPEVVTGSATDVTESTAVLNATVNPAALQTTYHFEYGTTSAYGTRVPAGIDAVAGNGRLPRTFSRAIEGLAPGTTYHFRIVATNSIGTSESDDATFTTASPGSIPVRAYEQVTPANKEGNPLDILEGFQASESGDSKLAYINRSGEQSSPTYAYKFSRRGATDWEAGIDLSVPLNETNTYPSLLVGATTLGISADFTHTFVATNRALAPGAIENGTNLYRVNVATGSSELIAALPIPQYLYYFVSIGESNKFVAGAPDYSWIVFRSPAPLRAGDPENALYRWSETDGLEVVSILPNGEATGGVVPYTFANPVTEVSTDGSRIYFTTISGPEKGVFLREGNQTRALTVSRVPGEPTAPQRGTFLGASKDGRYAFFLSYDEVKLTSDAPGLQGDVYRYDAVEESIEYVGLQAYTEGEFVFNQIPEKGNKARVAVSDNGDTLYVLEADPQLQGQAALLSWRRGSTAVVGPHSGGNGAVVSPDGRYAAYGEDGKLWLYDADTGLSNCVSCLPDGSPADFTLSSSLVIVSHQVPRLVTNAGQVFFSSTARLVSADVNGAQDVYMYQGGKVSLISPGNAPFDALISDISPDGRDVYFTTAQKLVGRDNDEAPDIYDARLGGGLASQNPPPSQECLRDDCKATPNAGPELPFGGSEALSGPENVKAVKHKKCGKGKRTKRVKGKVRCVKKHPKHRANKAGKGGNR
jgi:hypothetical protein